MKRSFGVGLAAVLASLVLGTGCGSKRVEAEAPKAAPVGNVAEYYPLAVGNSWTYRLNGSDDRKFTVEITREEGGYFHDNQNGQLALDGYGLRDPKRYLLRGPVQEGHSWTNVVSVSATERYHILHAGEPCQVPAGTFERCVQVEGRSRVDAQTTIVITRTFAPAVGMVRIDVVAERSNGERIPQTSLELTSWKVQGGNTPPAG